MAFIFGHRKKSPVELVKSTKKHIDLLGPHAPQDEKLIKKVNRRAQAKGEGGGAPQQSGAHAAGPCRADGSGTSLQDGGRRAERTDSRGDADRPSSPCCASCTAAPRAPAACATSHTHSRITLLCRCRAPPQRRCSLLGCPRLLCLRPPLRPAPVASLARFASFFFFSRWRRSVSISAT